jgi:[amino group carrier protein]-L-2-aminoadipate 6-kinase
MTAISRNHTIHVLKIGGGAGVDHSAALENLAARVRTGERWVLVHGASAAADELAEQVGYPARTITTPGGHSSRYNDARTIELFCAAAGTVNQQMTAELARHGINAVGLAGPNVITARRKTAIRALVNGRQVVIRDDYSGTITGVDGDLLNTLLDAGMVPVVAPVALGEQYERLNVDGDLVAAEIARALQADTLAILSNVPGLLRDIDDPGSLVTGFRLDEIERYESLAAGRMKKKLLAARHAEVERVILADSRRERPLDAALRGAGTHIDRERALAGALFSNGSANGAQTAARGLNGHGD